MKKTKRTIRPDIFVYHDYRAFLGDWFAYLRATEDKFSLRLLAKEASLANGYWPMVLSGKRKLSSRALAKSLPFLHLTQTEKKFLELLVILADEKLEQLRNDAFEKIQRYRGYRKTHPQEMEAYRYLSHWYYVAIREMALLPSFQLDARWIQERLLSKVGLRDIQQAIDFLIANRLLVKVGENGAKTSEKAVQCVGGIYRLALSAFHRQALGLASEALESVPRAERVVIGYTMPTSPKNYSKIVKILEETKDKIAKLEDVSEDKSEVYHIALTAFPLTKK